jgi:hypothetical protein
MSDQETEALNRLRLELLEIFEIGLRGKTSAAVAKDEILRQSIIFINRHLTEINLDYASSGALLANLIKNLRTFNMRTNKWKTQ